MLRMWSRRQRRLRSSRRRALRVSVGGFYPLSRSTVPTFNYGSRFLPRCIPAIMRLSTLRPGISSTRRRRPTKLVCALNALAQTQDGERAQILAWLVIDWQRQKMTLGGSSAGRPNRWRCSRGRTRCLPKFSPRRSRSDEDRVRARFSRHAALVRQSFSELRVCRAASLFHSPSL